MNSRHSPAHGAGCSPLVQKDLFESDSAPSSEVSRRTIYLVTHEFSPFYGGVATYVQELARAGARLGYIIEVITVSYRGRGEFMDTLARDEPGPCSVRRLAASGRLTPGGIGSLAIALWRERKRLEASPVVWLSAGVHMAAILLERTGLWSAPQAVNFFHGSEVFKFTKRPLWRLLAPKFYHRKRYFAAASRYVLSLLVGSGLQPVEARIFEAPCACPAALVDQLALAPITERTGGVCSPLVLLTVARIHRRKGQLDVARALALIPAEMRTRLVYRLIGTGDPAYLGEVATACADAGVPLEALGPLPADKLPAAYRACDIYVQTSRTLPDSVEGFGISYLEASASGKPIVAYDTGGVPEAVLRDRTGLLVEEGDLDLLAMQLSRLIGDPLLRLQLGQQGRAHATRFRWEDSARTLCEAALEAAAECAAARARSRRPAPLI